MPMTSLISPTTVSSTRLSLSYQVAMPEPTSHLFEVTLQITGWQAPILNLKMPVWTPGSYLVREYSRLVQDFQAVNLNSPHPDNYPPPWRLARYHYLKIFIRTEKHFSRSRF